IEFDPNYIQAYFNLGCVLSEHEPKDLDDAIVCFKQAIQLYPTYTLAHYRLGCALKAKGLEKQATAEFRECERLAVAPLREAFRLKATDATRIALARALVDLARTLITHSDPVRRDPDRAVSLAREAVELEPRQPVAWNTLGIALYRAGRWKDAIEKLER